MDKDTLKLRTLSYAIDFDDTLTKYPEFFDSLMGKKFILTGRPKEDAPKLKKEYPDYEVLCFPFSWLAGMAIENEQVVEILHQIARWKAKMVRDYQIDICFDDDYRLL